ncbi:MAG: hypothetical protein ACRC10_06635 [Thermoguttaceae bacterium]
MKTRITNLLLCICSFLSVTEQVWAQTPFKALVRNTARIADDVPLRSLENAVNPGSSKMAREMMETTGKGVNNSIPYTKQLLRQIEQTTGPVLDPAVLRTLGKLDEANLEAALLLSRGAQNVTHAVPDIATRAALLRNVDGNTLCVLGRYGNLADEAVLFNRALDSKGIHSASRAVTLDDFGNFFRQTGQGGYDFWMNTVKPHWKLFAAGGVLAVILITPEEYLNYGIETTAEGVKKIIRVVGKAGGEAGAAVAEGAGEGVVTMLIAMTKSVWGQIALLIGGLIGLIWLLSQSLVQIGITRFFGSIRRIWKWLFPPKELGPDVK